MSIIFTQKQKHKYLNTITKTMILIDDSHALLQSIPSIPCCLHLLRSVGSGGGTAGPTASTDLESAHGILFGFKYEPFLLLLATCI